MVKVLNLKVFFNCSSCADKIEQFLVKLPLVDHTIDIIGKTVEIEYDPAVIDETTILQAFGSNGFKYEII